MSRAAWLMRAITPPAITSVRDAFEFGHAHDLSSSRREWITGYRRAFRFGLHYLPPGFRLDGLIIDVGANRGDFTATVRQLEPRSTMIAVEPAPALAQSLRLRFHGDHAVTINARALADNEDGAVLHEAATAEFSSLLPVRGMAVLHDTPVETTTLDRLNAAPVRLLKLDVQGHEAAVLRGGIDTLGRTDAVLLEVVFTSQYEGDATFSSLDETMRGAGFALAGIGEPARYEGRATWTDACYVRDDLNLNQGLAATSP